MALFQKEEKPQRTDDTHLTSPPTSATHAEPMAARDFQANLGQGSRVDGRLTFDGSVRIDGHIEGEISAQDTVIIGEGAVVNAQIQANTIVVQGRVNGDITARKKVELRAPAKLVGNINTPSLVIHEGVTFEGHCTMGASEARADKSDKDKKVALFPKEGAVARASAEASS